MVGVEETHGIILENIIEAQDRQTKDAGGKVKTFVVGDRV
jgi:hypothetical protein